MGVFHWDQGMADNGRLPWFPFYVDRFMGSRKVQRMSAEQIGIYMLLLIEEWDSDAPLPTRGDDLVSICQGAPVVEIRNVLRLCFEKRKSGWTNKALEDIRRAQAAKHKRRVEAGKKRWKNQAPQG